MADPVEVMAEAMWRGQADDLPAMKRARDKEVWADQSDQTCKPWQVAAAAALSALDAAGFAVVPKEPTEAMASAGALASPMRAGSRRAAYACFIAMLSAAQVKP